MSTRKSVSSESNARIKELEKENSTLKSRLEELRRAKLQTIVKKDGTTTGKGPNLGRKSSTASDESTPSPELRELTPNDNSKLEEELKRYREKSRKQEEFIEQLQKQIEALKTSHDQQMATVKTSMLNDLRSLRDTHVQELQRLADEYNADLEEKRGQIEKFKCSVMNNSSNSLDHMKSIIEKLKKENDQLQEDNQMKTGQLVSLEDRISKLLTELSEKEATWCELEEKLRVEVQKSWGEKYQQWMVATEKKIDELRKTNEFLKEALSRDGPDN